MQEAQAEGEWADIMRLLPYFEGHGRLVFEYVELFSISPLKLKSKKILRLLKEVAKLFESSRFMFQKKEYEVSKPGIVEGLRAVCNKGFQEPLQNHNYLKKVLIGIAERERKGRREIEDKKVREAEDRRLKGDDSYTDKEHGHGLLGAEEIRKRAGDFVRNF